MTLLWCVAVLHYLGCFERLPAGEPAVADPLAPSASRSGPPPEPRPAAGARRGTPAVSASARQGAAPVETEERKETVETVDEARVEHPWLVVVWNDPVNLMSYVTYVFQKLFGFSLGRATSLMLDVHHKGRAVVTQRAAGTGGAGRRRGSTATGSGRRSSRRAGEPAQPAAAPQGRQRRLRAPPARPRARAARRVCRSSSRRCSVTRTAAGGEAPAALKRLLPPPTRRDEAAEAGYVRLVRADLLLHHRAALALLGETAHASRLSEEQLEGWLTALNDLRLVLGTSLEVTEDQQELPVDDPRYPQWVCYGYLSYLQNEVVEALTGVLPPPRPGADETAPVDPWGEPLGGLRWDGTPVPEGP